ncbi:hypothetical protein J7I93_05755 [Bacillus sp. ISL-47]|uniref:hypothetical protein n=1 Tax=Bacillus sp. ISL-47 TaxID=2819130 RepID=UPI001BE5D436|nr:hypothetical protein [Bacillus sp. ISL-47]MBT2687676.1 hypothetical protein [Bacillus sp. ISL-47]MBT2707449.1 hypothetical protein [Pseudomonas sp. ISL-84]
MKLIFEFLFLSIVIYYSYHYIILITKMKKKTALIPFDKIDLKTVRKFPQKSADAPVISKNKLGLTMYAVMLFFLIATFIFGKYNMKFSWTYLYLLFIPLINAKDLLNVFAVFGDGFISGSKFVPWKKVKSFHFKKIVLNHKYYGYSQEVNEGYELILKTKMTSHSLVVTEEEMKERLASIFEEHVKKG